MGIISWKFYLRDKFRKGRRTLKSNIWTLINGQRDLKTVASGGGVPAPKPKLQNDLKGLDMKTGSFTLRQLSAATNNFDPANKIGEGGFGSVYKGELSDGYMAPEYALWGYLTEKADVYSFGVVALEIVSGRSNSSYNPTDENVCLLDRAFVLQKRGNLMEIVDPKLGSDEFNKVEAEKVIKVALLCTIASPTLRPTMPEVVNMLEGQTSIQEVISDPTIYGGDFQVNNVNDILKQALDQSLTSCNSQDHISSYD
ncbi:hypothetical protein SADUNF_Sadunf04G0043400 [Salix dunnii]|uniref:Protein kinase domain-containing protein n=1 Tax=Salix dunnii TaxID=1413687 RepID=A0A835K826_9ROSI|nr:hypothetical protein SADUNF_Sadunf04G0043400 [Salix dunnii]